MSVMLAFESRPELPPLSWCVRVRSSGPAIVHHGVGVETREDGFIEGAWDGDFEAFDFDGAQTVAGTGARVRDGRLVVVGTSHPLERLFVAERAEDTVISSSLVFVLAATGDWLDTSYPRYFFDLAAQTHGGIMAPPVRIRTRRGHVIEGFIGCNLEVGSTLKVTRVAKALGAAPRNYAELFDLLEGTMTRVARNAMSPARRRRYPLVAACSRGYDSTAAAALARGAGCREGVAFRTSRARSGHPLLGTRYQESDDSGREALEALGMRVTEFDRLDILSIPDFPRAEFYLSPAITDACSRVMEDSLRGHLLISGRHGERYWCPRARCAKRDLGEPDDYHLSGQSLGEFRARAGFLHLPVPYVGARHGAALLRISRSDEMRPWRLGTEYDRPIARRIAEDAGVPREIFGQYKMGAGHMGRELDPATERELRAFVSAEVPEHVRRRLDARPLQERIRTHQKLAYLRTNYSHLPGAPALLNLVGANRLHILWNSLYLYQFHWGAAKIAERYTIVGPRG